MTKHALFIAAMVMTVIGTSAASAGEPVPYHEPPLRLALLGAVPADSGAAPASVGVDFSSYRFRKAVVMSVLIPGSGQTYFGNTLKGAGFSVLAIGGVVAGYIYNSDIVSNNERLQDVRSRYYAAGKFDDADAQYRLMLTLTDQSDRYQTKRNICLAVGLTAWVLNIADMVFNTPDQGRDDMLAAGPGKIQLLAQSDGAAIRLAFGR